MKTMTFAACVIGLAMAWTTADASPAQNAEDLLKPGSQQGEVVYVDCGSKVPEAWILFSIDYFTRESKFKITLKKGTFALPAPVILGNASLFLVDDPTLPPMLVAPESRWTMVNMAQLKTSDRRRFEDRVKRQLSRGFAFLCGGGESEFVGSLMSVVRAEQLDKQEDHRLPIDVISRFVPMMSEVGVTPAIYADYETACQEGWAPAPTNQWQKAVWDKVHAPPSKPMKITYDKDKQKPVVK